MQPRTTAVGRRIDTRRPRLSGVPVPARALGIGAGWLDHRSGSRAESIEADLGPDADVIDLWGTRTVFGSVERTRGARRGQASGRKSEVA